MKNFLFVIKKLKLIKKSYDSISKTLFIPHPIPKSVENPLHDNLVWNENHSIVVEIDQKMNQSDVCGTYNFPRNRKNFG